MPSSCPGRGAPSTLALASGPQWAETSFPGRRVARSLPGLPGSPRHSALGRPSRPARAWRPSPPGPGLLAQAVSLHIAER